MKNQAGALAILSSMVFIGACAAGDTQASEPQSTVTVTETVTATPEPEIVTATPEPEPEPEPARESEEEVSEDLGDFSLPEDLDGVEGAGFVGDTVVNYGVEMTVHDAYLADTIPWNENGQRPDSARYEITELPADAGQWFVVETAINNVGSTSMDLTCGWPIDAVAVDTQEREFDTLDSLYKYENNPWCNDNLQPGFEAEMTYAFNVPDDAQLIALAFRDTEESAWGDYSAIIFDPADS